MSERDPRRRILLVRHTAVAMAWTSRCYGATDVPLSSSGRRDARVLARDLARHRPSAVYTSPLRRAAFLAALIAREANVNLHIDRRLAERHFGTWERRSWGDIYAETGDAMMGMLSAPATFRPGGGETTYELRDRVVEWRNELPPIGLIVVVCHGGPIAALVGSGLGLEPIDWPRLVPPVGGCIDLVPWL